MIADKPVKATAIPVVIGVLMVLISILIKKTESAPDIWTAQKISEILKSEAFKSEVHLAKKSKLHLDSVPIQGVIIKLIRQEGLLKNLGLEVDDFVSQVNGMDVVDEVAFQKLIEQFPRKKEIELVVYRNREKIFLKKILKQ